MPSARHWRQYVYERATVPGIRKSIVKNGHDATVFVGSDEAANGLRK